MKRIYIALIIACCCYWSTWGQQASISIDKSARTEIKKKSEQTSDKLNTGNTGITVSSSDDSVYTAEYVDVPGDVSNAEGNTYAEYDEEDLHPSLGGYLLKSTGLVDSTTKVVFITFCFLFGFPLVIIFFAFYFRYRSRRARYKLIEKALASGQTIPEELWKVSMKLDNRSQGIRNICTGIGLFIFLWAITDSLGIGCIGLLIMFTGIGQVLTSRNEPPTNED